MVTAKPAKRKRKFGKNSPANKMMQTGGINAV